jgi:DNA segregation ATPase FtsK/SpoIIIE, S-DNA-T family
MTAFDMAERKPRTKTPKAPKELAKQGKPIIRLDPQRKEEIAAISVAILALLTALGAFELSGGFLLTWWTSTLRQTLGWGVYLAPFLLVSLAVWLFLDSLDKIVNIGWERPIGLGLGYVLLLAVFHWAAALNDPLQGLKGFRGGGIIGWAITSLLVQSIGTIGGAVVIAALGAISLILLFNISIPELIRRFVYVVGITLNLRHEVHWLRREGQTPTIRFGPPQSTATERAPRSAPFVRTTPSVAIRPEPSPPRMTVNRTDDDAAAPPLVTARIIGGDADTLAPKQPGPTVQREWQLPRIAELRETNELEINKQEILKRKQVIEETLAHFGVPAQVREVNQGPTITQFGVEPGFVEQRGIDGKTHLVKVKVSRISTLQHDLELALAAAPIRIEAPVPGRGVVGIEVPNMQIALVSLRSVMESEPFEKSKSKLKLALGQDVSGLPIVADLATMPHLLIAGATGSGKSVCINAVIASLLFTCTPDDARFVMIDPKRVELVSFNDIPHLLRPVVVEVGEAVNALKEVVEEMDRRFKLFAQKGARNIELYNQMIEGKGSAERLPLLIVIVDELADLMMVAADEVEKAITRLAQMARATGIHLILATQRPSVDVVTGLIKANFPSRISFAVTSQIDSRVVLDAPGAEKLLGRGDMLYMASDSSKLIRLQGCFVSDDELGKIVIHWKNQAPSPSSVSRSMTSLVQSDFLKHLESKKNGGEDLLPQAIEIIKQSQRASVSFLQRKLRIGYARAAKLMEQLEEQGLVGPDEGPTKGRIVVAQQKTKTVAKAVRKGSRDSIGDDFDDWTDEDWEDLDH